MNKSILNNRYLIVKELGYGGFGTTYLAQDRQNSNSLCAVKKLNADHADIKTAKRLFKREADTLLRLQEVPQVPKFIDYFEENNCNYIVEEYIEGLAVDKLLSQQWNEQDIFRFLWDILSILQLLHEKNIVHRDLKPSNLIQRNKDHKFTIIDFGAVKELDPNQKTLGTGIYHQGYTPIEQVQGKPQLNSDIHALGMTAIQLLTKEPPREVIRDPLDQAISPEARFASSWLIEILNKMVRSNFQERYQSVDQVLRDLGQSRNYNQLEENSINHESETLATNSINQTETTKKQTTLGTKYHSKFIYLTLILIPLLLVTSELVRPWIRPWYYLNQGDKLLDNNQAQSSLAKFKQAIALKRDYAAAWKSRGDALFSLRRYPGALSAYNKSLSLAPDNVKVLNSKGKILSKQGEFTQAINIHQQVIDLDPNNGDAWSNLGLAYMNQQKFDDALESFEEAQKIKPDNPTFWIQKGIVLKNLQRSQEVNVFYQEALAVYEEIIDKNDQDPATWSDKGFVLLQLNRPQEAYAAYDKALRINEKFYEALLGKANVLTISQQYEGALQMLDLAISYYPGDYQVWYNRGNLQLQVLKQPEPALKSFTKAVQINPKFLPAWLGQGLTLSNLQRYSESLVALNKAKELNPQNPFVWLNLGIVYEALGNSEFALSAYKMAATELKFQPANEYLERLEQKLGL